MVKKLIDGYCHFLSYFIAAALALMVVLVFGNVFMRYAFNSGFSVSEELSRWLFVWVTFMGAVVALRTNSHLGTDILVGRLGPKGKKFCMGISLVLMLFCLWLLFRGSYEQAVINWDTTSAVMEVSVSYFYASGMVFAVLGGLIVAQAGIAWAFAVNALTFLGVAVVLWRWRRVPVATALPPETFGVALRAGLRYAMQASVLQAVLVKAAGFFTFASALTALLPIVVKQDLQASAGTYGLLLGCIGAGAIAGAMVLPGLRTRLDPDRLVLVATLAYAGCTLGVALLRWIHLLYAVALLAGFAWIAVLSSLQIAAQTAVPAWVRARALSLYIVVFSAGMAAGSLGWGAAAQAFGTPAALAAAAVGTALAALFGLRFRLGEAARVNVTPSGHWPQPIVSPELEDERGPVLVTVEYRIDSARRTTFLQRMQPLGRARRRNGALQWGVAEDSTQPGVYLEYFVDASWREHLRQHERVTEDERAIQDALLETLADPAQRPLVRHFIGGAPGVAPPSAAPAQGGLA